MKVLFILFSWFNIVCLSAISPEFITGNLSHDPCSLRGVDAAFFFSNSRATSPCFISDQFADVGFAIQPLSLYNINTVPQEAVLKYCSENISPELLAQILNHNSIYAYCMDHNLGTALIAESRSTLKGSPLEIEIAIQELKNVDPLWDVLFLNSDYCSGSKLEEHIAPQIIRNGRVVPNKQVLSSLLSKVFCRYGFTCYVISRNGMEKILRFFSKHWPDLPLDQAVFSIHALNMYSVNKDLIANGIVSQKKGVKHHFFYPRKEFELGKEFWIEPIELVSPSRIDIIAKYSYAKSILNNEDVELNKKRYLEHIQKWNNFYEGAPLKIGAKAFDDSFKDLIANLQKNGYDPKASPVPIDTNGQIVNGSHRVGACLALGIPVKVKVVNKSKSNKPMTCFTKYFREKLKVSSETVDHFVSQYCQLKPYIYKLKFSGIEIPEHLISSYVDIIDVNGDTCLVEAKNPKAYLELVNALYANPEIVSALCL